MNTSEDILPLLEMLVARLERLSADSNWAHRASGLRGSLLHYQEKLLTRQGSELNLTPGEVSQLEQLMRGGFAILEKAAREIDLPNTTRTVQPKTRLDKF